MKRRENKIKLSKGGVSFICNADKGITIDVFGYTKNGEGKYHKVNITLDKTDMSEIVRRSKRWAKSKVESETLYLSRLLNTNTD